MDFEEFKVQREKILNERASGIHDNLKKVKVLARAIYTEAAAPLMCEDSYKNIDLEDMADDCIEAAMKFESAFALFESRSIGAGRLRLSEIDSEEKQNE